MLPTKLAPSACSCPHARPAPPHAWGTPVWSATLWTPGAHASNGFPAQTHPEHHFIIDWDEWDFYAMDAYRVFGDNRRAAAHARSVIRISTRLDGTEIPPLRAAEARRKSLPPLLLVADELDRELHSRYPKKSERATSTSRSQPSSAAQPGQNCPSGPQM